VTAELGAFLATSIRKSSKWFQSREEGFTLIELLIVVAILGVLAGVVIPNVGAFVKTGTLNAANMELENVKTASVAYYAENEVWPSDTSVMTTLISGTPKATYTFDTVTGYVIGVSGVTWSGIVWSAPPGPPYSRHGEWTK
jgi:type IV pilus assembly protein PilA